ncbi:hypothetical protein BH18ACI2_BH18ACI2_13540 [soil metagenome]|jgi:hypothetical protein
MVLLPDFLKGREARLIRLRLPKSKIAFLLTEMHFGEGFMNVNDSFHMGLYWMVDAQSAYSMRLTFMTNSLTK